MREVLQISADQFYVMGVAPLPDGYGIVRNNVHNVPKAVPNATAAASPALSNPAQYFMT